jgi:hypothetical protein
MANPFLLYDGLALALLWLVSTLALFENLLSSLSNISSELGDLFAQLVQLLS